MKFSFPQTEFHVDFSEQEIFIPISAANDSGDAEIIREALKSADVFSLPEWLSRGDYAGEAGLRFRVAEMDESATAPRDRTIQIYVGIEGETFSGSVKIVQHPDTVAYVVDLRKEIPFDFETTRLRFSPLLSGSDALLEEIPFGLRETDQETNIPSGRFVLKKARVLATEGNKKVEFLTETGAKYGASCELAVGGKKNVVFANAGECVFVAIGCSFTGEELSAQQSCENALSLTFPEDKNVSWYLFKNFSEEPDLYVYAVDYWDDQTNPTPIPSRIQVSSGKTVVFKVCVDQSVDPMVLFNLRVDRGTPETIIYGTEVYERGEGDFGIYFNEIGFGMGDAGDLGARGYDFRSEDDIELPAKSFFRTVGDPVPQELVFRSNQRNTEPLYFAPAVGEEGAVPRWKDGTTAKVGTGDVWLKIDPFSEIKSREAVYCLEENEFTVPRAASAFFSYRVCDNRPEFDKFSGLWVRQRKKTEHRLEISPEESTLSSSSDVAELNVEWEGVSWTRAIAWPWLNVEGAESGELPEDPDGVGKTTLRCSTETPYNRDDHVPRVGSVFLDGKYTEEENGMTVTKKIMASAAISRSGSLAPDDLEKAIEFVSSLEKSFDESGGTSSFAFTVPASQAARAAFSARAANASSSSFSASAITPEGEPADFVSVSEPVRISTAGGSEIYAVNFTVAPNSGDARAALIRVSSSDETVAENVVPIVQAGTGEAVQSKALPLIAPSAMTFGADGGVKPLAIAAGAPRFASAIVRNLSTGLAPVDRYNIHGFRIPIADLLSAVGFSGKSDVRLKSVVYARTARISLPAGSRLGLFSQKKPASLSDAIAYGKIEFENSDFDGRAVFDDPPQVSSGSPIFAYFVTAETALTFDHVSLYAAASADPLVSYTGNNPISNNPSFLTAYSMRLEAVFVSPNDEEKTAWTVTTAQSWIHPSALSGSGSGTINVTVDPIA